MVNVGYKQAKASHTLFIKRQGLKMKALIVYMDDIVVTGSDEVEIVQLNNRLAK